MRTTLVVSLLIAAGPACSLGLEREPPAQARFLIEAARPEREPPAAAGVVVEVGTFHAASAFAGLGFVYRTAEHRYETDFYREFLIAPELAVSDAVRSWLADAGVAAAVVGPGSRTTPTHDLEGDVVALYGDFRDPGHPQAVLELRIALLERSGGIAVTRGSYAETEAVGSTDADDLPAAWSRALARALARVEADLRAAFAR